MPERLALEALTRLDLTRSALYAETLRRYEAARGRGD